MTPVGALESVPLTETSISNGPVRLHVLTAGPSDAPLVVLIHGFPARWSTWRAPMQILARAGFFVAAPDMRGYGGSDRPEGVRNYGVAHLAGDVAAIVRGLGRDRAFIAGHDVGGGVAWATAMLYPAMVARLAILNSVHPVGFQRQMRELSQLAKSWYVFFFQLPWIPEAFVSRDDFRFLRKALADDGLAEDTIRDLLEGVRPPGALRAAIHAYRASFRDAVSRRFTPTPVRVPALVVWGDRERHLDAALAVPPSDWVTNARVEHLPAASHWVHHDAPEEVSELLIAHFRA